MIIYPILIATARVGSIWIRSRIGKKILLSATHILILMTIVEINKKNKQYDPPN